MASELLKCILGQAAVRLPRKPKGSPHTLSANQESTKQTGRATPSRAAKAGKVGGKRGTHSEDEPDDEERSCRARGSVRQDHDVNGGQVSVRVGVAVAQYPEGSTRRRCRQSIRTHDAEGSNRRQRSCCSYREVARVRIECRMKSRRIATAVD